MQSEFPKQQDGIIYLTEGGTETEIMYKHGYDFPHFAVFELLQNPKAVATLQGMYRSYFDVVSKYKMSALVGGLDYRASPDWGKLLGYSASGLSDINHQCIDFLRNIASEYSTDIETILIQGLIGPRGDAYETNRTITVNEAQDYHSVQLETLKAAGVDIASALTFSSIAESIGVARAAAEIGVPLSISLLLSSNAQLDCNHNLAEAIYKIDTQTDGSTEYFMINCCHPIEYEPAFIESNGWVKRIRGIRPNASKMDKISLCKIGHLEDGDPVELGKQVGELINRYPHMDILGGCCGTWDRHLDQIAKNSTSAVRSA